MNRVLNDFVNNSWNTKGPGFFDGDTIAYETARGLSKNQVRKLQRYDLVPLHFFQYMAQIGVIRQSDIPKGTKAKGWLLDFLRWYHYKNEQSRSFGEYLYREIIKADIPWLAKSFANGDFIWEHLKAKVNRKVKKCRTT